MTEIVNHGDIPVVQPVQRPVTLIPVGAKEAALDSPSFRAGVIHFSDQVDAVEKWLEGIARAATKLSQEASTLESVVRSFSNQCTSSSQLSEAILDHDYTLTALRGLGHGGAQEVWLKSLVSMKVAQSTVAEPIRQFINNDIRPFKEAKRSLEQYQKAFDGLLLRYASQSKTKEPSSLREDAWQVHEARKAYLRASLDIAVISPQIRLALDTLLIKVCTDQWETISNVRKAPSQAFEDYDTEIMRVKDWAEDLTNGEKPLRRELLVARKDIEESAESISRPSRELDDYAIHTVPYLGSRPAPPGNEKTSSWKQGWLFLRTITGKPARTQWVRRWFFVKNGIFGCLVHGARSGGVEESEKIGVLLCGVRPAFQEERRFCFEVKTKDNTILLQAETQSELSSWIQAFEAAKKQAIEDSDATDMLASSGNPSADAAFAVSPALSPELAAKRADGQITSITEDTQANLLSAEPDTTPNMQARSSFDVGSAKRMDGEREGERTRDHAARILEKLDIHKKSTAGPQLTGGMQSPTGGGTGVSSLLATMNTPRGTSPNPSASSPRSQFSTSLVPSTLANPPVQTHLTKIALKVGVDKGVDLGSVDSTGGVPSSIMANQWGSANYGYISRLERGEVGRKQPSQPPSQPQSPPRRSSDPTDAVDDTSKTQTLSPTQKTLSPTSGQAADALAAGHRKTFSTESWQNPRPNKAFSDYPSFYPPLLRIHDSQFRILFPNVPHDERIVLVFRAAWNPDQGHSLPGRVFVTQREMFFYSHHMGLVVVHGASLENIAEVSLEADSIHNYLYLHMKEDAPSTQDDGIMLKIFLDAPRMLEQRLNYLVQTNDSEEPDSLETTLQKLTQIEANIAEGERFRRADTFDDDKKLARRMTGPKGTRLRVDRSLNVGMDGTDGIDATEPARFKLPSQPVVYTPLDVTARAAEKTYEISAKALLHVLFGDKSAVCPTIYQQRGSEVITQLPWIRVDDKGHFKRQFNYQIGVTNLFGAARQVSVIDLQSIDVASDHLCYMVTETKVPWHLPRPKDFTLVTKVVVTHEAKSKSKLSIFTKVNWSRTPWLGKTIIERRAIDDMEMDALNMVDVVTEQVQRLGPGCSTRRVIEIFGGIGQQTEAAQVKAPTDVGRPLRTSVQNRTIVGLVFETVRSVAESATSNAIMLVVGGIKFVAKTVNAHMLLVFLLLISSLYSFYNITGEARIWWHDRHTARYVKKLGIVPNLSMSRSLYLADVAEAVAQPINMYNATSSQCSEAFQGILSSTSLDDTTAMTDQTLTHSPSTRSTANRLRRTRQRLGVYRHDLTVALRLINRIERDAVKAEYENWLFSETKTCSRIENLLQKRIEQRDVEGKPNDTSTNEPSKFRGDNDRTQQVSAWLGGYCESCRNDSLLLENVAYR